MKFEKGNKGKPKGAKSERTKQWEALAETITGQHAELFNDTLLTFLSSPKEQTRQRGCELYLQALEYFKPKQARIQHTGENGGAIQIVEIPSNT